MPFAPPRHCPAGHPPFTGRRCPVCLAAAKARADAARPSARARGYDSKWSRESKAFLARPENRLCACGCGQVAEMVDHKVAHKGDKRLFWDRSNWQPMTKACNSRKAVREEGAFGNPIRKAGGDSVSETRDRGPAVSSRAQSSGNWEFWG